MTAYEILKLTLEMVFSAVRICLLVHPQQHNPAEIR
jgi:hypothetical protein